MDDEVRLGDFDVLLGWSSDSSSLPNSLFVTIPRGDTSLRVIVLPAVAHASEYVEPRLDTTADDSVQALDGISSPLKMFRMELRREGGNWVECWHALDQREERDMYRLACKVVHEAVAIHGGVHLKRVE